MQHARSTTIAKIARGVAGGAALALIAAPALAAGGGDHHGFPWKHFVTSLINFAIFMGILVKFALPKVNAHFAERRKALMADLDAARAALEVAEAQLSEIQGLVDGLKAEREALLEEYHKQGQREKERLVAEAEAHAAKLRKDAEVIIAQETKKAVATLKQRAADEAVQLAQAQITERLGAEQSRQRQLVAGFVSDLRQIKTLDRPV